MTPEERLDRIESLLGRHVEFVGTSLTKQNEQIEKQNEGIRGLTAEIDKQNAGIQGLIVVARTVLTSIQELRTVQDKMIEEVRELHKHTDEKLNILIDTVDRIIRRDNGRKGDA